MWSRRDVRRLKHFAYVCALSPLSPLAGPRIRFFILATPRSGSTLLVNLLDGHPDIRCENEILPSRVRQASTTRFIDARAVLARVRKRARAYGCKAVAEQVAALPPDERSTFVSQLHQRGYRIIVVTRRDTLARAMSRLEARRADKWIYRTGENLDRPPLAVDPAELEGELQFAERSLQFVEGAVEHLPHIRLIYEDDLESPSAQQATLDRICTELGLPSTRAATNLVRGGPPSIRDRIANYDEVMDTLRQSRFAAYAEPDLLDVFGQGDAKDQCNS